jgi:hypothetical protein
MHKRRGYNRETPLVPVRDYTLFAIACEGYKTEPEYFQLFSYMSRKIKVDIIDYTNTEESDQPGIEQKSAPKWVLDKAVKYIDTEGLIDEDTLWFVLDVDRWDREQLRNIAQLCQDKPNWHIVLSNPCFEVWLYFHKKANIADSKSVTCRDFKHEISTFESGGYHPLKFIPYLLTAIANAKAADNSKEHYSPEFKETKVYLLGESLLEIIGPKSFNEFLTIRLPEMVEQKKMRAKGILRKK